MILDAELIRKRAGTTRFQLRMKKQHDAIHKSSLNET
jgi:hypothetical protein